MRKGSAVGGPGGLVMGALAVVPVMAIVGGLVVFGAAGVILGPVTLTVTMLLFEIWRRRTE